VVWRPRLGAGPAGPGHSGQPCRRQLKCGRVAWRPDRRRWWRPARSQSAAGLPWLPWRQWRQCGLNSRIGAGRARRERPGNVGNGEGEPTLTGRNASPVEVAGLSRCAAGLAVSPGWTTCALLETFLHRAVEGRSPARSMDDRVDTDGWLNTVTSPDGTRIAFWRSGQGPPLLLVHGATADHTTTWRLVLPELERRFTVYAMDRRGRGGSGDGTAYELRLEAEDVQRSSIRPAGQWACLVTPTALCARSKLPC
jgi:hypothetical protein